MKALKISATRILKRITLLSLVFFTITLSSFSQDPAGKKKQRARIEFGYYNNKDKSQTLKATLYYIQDKMRVPLTHELIYFYAGEINPENVIDSAFTDRNGVARLHFDSMFKFPADEERYSQLSAEFKGNDSYMKISNDIRIKVISMELLLTEIEGKRTILVRAYEKGISNELYPLNNVDIYFYVPRLFGDQLIGEGNFIDGKSSIAFPKDIAGDSIGNISVIARIEDNEDYGNVERILTDFRWGDKKPFQEHKSLLTIQITIPTRGLWHSNAPLWMIITLVILLTGVWSHYLYVIFQLIKLARLRKKRISTAENGDAVN